MILQGQADDSSEMLGDVLFQIVSSVSVDLAPNACLPLRVRELTTNSECTEPLIECTLFRASRTNPTSLAYADHECDAAMLVS